MPRGAFAGALGAGAGASAMVWLPLWGLPLAFAGRGAARWGGYRFCAFVVMCRAALRRVRAAVARAFGVSVALAAQLSISAGSSAGSATEVWSGAAGDVSYRASSAIGMCAGGMVAFWGAKKANVGNLFVCCRMTSPSMRSRLFERSVPARGRATRPGGPRACDRAVCNKPIADRMRGAGAVSDADWGPSSIACLRWQASARKKRRPEAISEG